MSYRLKAARAPLLLLSVVACFGSALAQVPAPNAPQPTGPAVDAATAPQAPGSAHVGSAQTEPAVEAIAPASPSTAVDAGPCCTLPDGTAVQLEIVEALNSKTAQRGQRFKLKLAAPLQTAEGVLVPVGTEGEGEVIHAARAGAGGKAGELILAARFLGGPNGEIKLRGMKLGGIGKDQRDSASALLIGTAVAAPILTPVAFLVRGGNLEIPIGMPAQAKLAGSLHLPPLPAAASPNTEITGTAPATGTGEETPNPSSSETPL